MDDTKMEMNRLIQHLKTHTPEGHAVLGFDAFVDRVSRRAEGLGSGPIRNMSDFGQRLLSRQDRSGTVLLRQVEERLGGNMPNTARVLSSLGGRVSCIGAFGRGQVEKVFSPLEKTCRLVPFADPGSCLAVEFGDSKLFFGANGEMDELTWPEITRRVSLDQWIGLYAQADVAGLFNWAELKSTQRIWDGLLSDVLPALPDKPRTFFFDFSDITGRAQEDIECALGSLKRFRQYGRVIVSANAMESERLIALNVLKGGTTDLFILHTKSHSALYSPTEQFMLPTRFCREPVILTGGGDCFNGGYIYGQMCGLTPVDCLKCGSAAAGCFSRTGKAPDPDALIGELEASREIWS